MTANGVNGVNGCKGGANETLQWRIGLMNFENKYLTAETFGFKINASGTSLRKKQVWVLEHDSKSDDVVYLKSHLGRYLSTDKFGNVKCESEETGADEKFVIAYDGKGSGRWAIKSYTHKYYFGGTADNVKCYDLKTGPKDQEWWKVHLAIHPQVNLRNANRRYCHYKDNQIQCNENIPWGQDSLITIEFFDGKYALKTCDNRYLHRDGSLTNTTSVDTLFTLEIKSGNNPGLAFKDNNDKYLTAVGQDATVVARNKTIGKFELFTLEDSHPQVFFVAHNSKKVSIKQGIDATANQDELTDTETFQLEFDKDSEKWRMRSCQDKYWKLDSLASGIQVTATGRADASTLFGIEWQDDSTLAIKASNDNYLTAKQNGSLYAVSDRVTDKEKFYLAIMNRPILILKCAFGFVGFKSATNPRIECNKSSSEIIYMEYTDGQNAAYYFKGTNGKYWSVGDDGMINAESDQPQPFYLQLTGQSRFNIKTADGRYIKGEQNGIFQAKSTDVKDGTLWEY